MTSDDGSRLFVDDQLLIDDWTTHPLESRSASLTFSTPGTHKIVLEYLQAAGPAEIHLAWTPPGESQSVIPNSALRPSAYGNQTSVVGPAGSVVFSHFADPASQKPDYVLEGGSLGLLTSYSYDSLGRPTQKIMPKGNLQRAIDAQGDLTGSPDLSYATTWTYYSSGETAAAPAACGTLPAVNQAGLLKTVKQEGSWTQTGDLKPGGVSSVTTVYDLAGRALAITNGRGTTCSQYDGEGRLLSERVPGEAQVSGCADTQATACYGYDPAGASRTAMNANGTVTLEYDEAGRVIRSLDASGAEARLAYDLNSNLISDTAAVGSLSSSTNYSRTYSYDGIDQLTNVKEPPNFNTYFSYDKRGNLKAVHQLNSTFAWFDYNSAGWLTHAYNRHGTLSLNLPPTAPADLNPLADHEYGYDIEGRRTSETRIAGGEPIQATSYTYDAMGRLATFTMPTGMLRTYLFDADSNRTEITERPNGGQTETVATYAYDPAQTPGIDELTTATVAGATTSYNYTADGQTAQRGADSITWDGRGRTSGASVAGAIVTYSYDALGRLVARVSASGGQTTTTRYLYVGNGETAYFETDVNGSITSTPLDGAAGPFAQYAGPPDHYSTPETYLYYNGHGDLTATAGSNGVRNGSYTYDAFGAPNQSIPSNQMLEWWTARWHKKLDTMSGLILMGARPYDPAVGRFLSIDPVDGGSLNNYDYVGQDPVNSYDLDGTICWRCVRRAALSALKSGGNAGKAAVSASYRGGARTISWGWGQSKVAYTVTRGRVTMTYRSCFVGLCKYFTRAAKLGAGATTFTATQCALGGYQAYTAKGKKRAMYAGYAAVMCGILLFPK